MSRKTTGKLFLVGMHEKDYRLDQVEKVLKESK